jgi:hypothetical protein
MVKAKSNILLFSSFLMITDFNHLVPNKHHQNDVFMDFFRRKQLVGGYFDALYPQSDNIQTPKVVYVLY